MVDEPTSDEPASRPIYVREGLALGRARKARDEDGDEDASARGAWTGWRRPSIAFGWESSRVRWVVGGLGIVGFGWMLGG